MQSLKDGWLIALGRYCEITLYIKHCKVFDCYSESLLIPLCLDPEKFSVSQSILAEANVEYSEVFSSIPEGKSKDLSSGSLSQSRLVLCKIPASLSSFDVVLSSLYEGLEISNCLGCSSACIPFEKVLNNYENSAEVLVESFENYALKNLDNCVCLKEITICMQTEEEIKAVIEVCKFRMTRYSVFVNIGLPDRELIPGCLYCYSCSRVYAISNKCQHLMSD